MGNREAVLTGTQKALSSPAIRAGHVWMARGAITVVLAVTGSALLLVALTVLEAAPIAAFAAVGWASWRASARLGAELDRA